MAKSKSSSKSATKTARKRATAKSARKSSATTREMVCKGCGSTQDTPIDVIEAAAVKFEYPSCADPKCGGQLRQDPGENLAERHLEA